MRRILPVAFAVVLFAATGAVAADLAQITGPSDDIDELEQFTATGAVAADLAQITGLSDDIDELELFANVDDDDPVRAVAADALSLPADILAESDNGMLQLDVGGQSFWVISDDVLTTSTRSIDAACDPKVAGKLVAHGKRGAGEDCQ